MEDPVIVVDNVSKYFLLPHEKVTSVKGLFTGMTNSSHRTKEKQQALKDISFEIKEGEFFGIVGRNGSGKSTLLKILANIYQPTAGKVYTRGKLVPFIELGVGFNPELTGKENVYLNGAMLGFSQKEIKAMYDDIVKFAELERFMDQKLKNYSSGMQVRLAFSMATRSKADILLIDEVLAVGDAAFQRKCYEYFQQIKSEGKTVVFVTHDMMAVRQYCDRVAVIEGGNIVNVTDPESAAKQYMQLFATEEDKSGYENKSNRWGDKKAIYSKVKASLSSDGRYVIVATTLEAKEKVPDPTYGIMIANEARQPIMGTNSKIEEHNAKPLRGGDKVEINWKFPNIFNEGRFHVELVLMYNSVTEVADWWENAASFRVSNEKRTPYIVNPPTEFQIEGEDE
jgi:ABC-2 type transport system ATP-binding protein